MSAIPQHQPRMGTGIPGLIGSLKEHNPQPSTPRGKRRHANRSDQEKKVAEAAWNRARSNVPSRYQEKLDGRK